MLDNIDHKPSAVFVKVEGARSKDIRILHTPLTTAGNPVALGAGVAKDAVRIE